MLWYLVIINGYVAGVYGAKLYADAHDHLLQLRSDWPASSWILETQAALDERPKVGDFVGRPV